MILTEQDIENGKIYCADFHGGWIPEKCDFLELSKQLATMMKQDYGNDWFMSEPVQRVVNPIGTWS